MHPDLDTIVAADDEGRQRVAEARERLTTRAGETRAAAEERRNAQVAAVRAECDAAVRMLRDAARLRLDERRHRHQNEMRRRRDRSEPALESAVERYLAILLSKEPLR